MLSGLFILVQIVYLSKIKKGKASQTDESRMHYGRMKSCH